MGGADRGGQRICERETLAYRNQKFVKSVFVCSTHTFHKNICCTVCLNSTGFCDSTMVNIGSYKCSVLLSVGYFLLHSYCK